MFWVLGKAKDRLCDLYAGVSIQRNATVVARPDFQTARGPRGIRRGTHLGPPRNELASTEAQGLVGGSVLLHQKLNLHEYLRTVPDLFKEGIS